MPIIKREIKREPEKRYPVPEVSMAIGISENAIYGYFSNRGVTTRDGLTLDQIEEVCLAKRRGGINWALVREVEDRLQREKGITVIKEDAAYDVLMLDDQNEQISMLEEEDA